jgi:hypothetical protein
LIELTLLVTSSPSSSSLAAITGNSPMVGDGDRGQANVPALAVHQIKPGMKIITTTTPRLITKVETVTGKVFHVSPPNCVILTLEDGTNQRFNIPKDQKLTIAGKETDAFGLRKGMIVSATRISETQETIVAQEIRHTGTLPPTPSEPKPDVPILVAVGAPAAAERDVLPVANSPPQPSDTQTPCASYPQFLPSRQLVSLLWRKMTTPALVFAGQC